ncbi:type I-MYXAN CRISPR-associated endonuclease Cas4/Cas1 [Rubinisphaera margarita]|uniref:type I-MYXAN CRISPR-associated endonuclease Cas4/Cas1 n=1 Tax=Rubinisphaera margarita TaxID=2909586 RepID=UPI001EE9A439|nr:type I-MYXAN CRISPR-associated endonuclease Cas1 [Rubinisphaera margarita]MCG6157257.1 type I-MYXAN CRISPR-associated endonuclease Cas1 [Rubinisphaera margarita]
MIVSSTADRSIDPPLRVMALHALLYCERLFYLEEVEEIRVADANVYAGRRLHDDVAGLDDETPEKRSLELSSDQWGLFGKVDAVRRRDGKWVVYEHKRGRCRRGDNKEPLAWDSDRIQAVAYAVLLEEHFGESVPEARIRYHADKATAFVQIDQQARDDLRTAVTRADHLRNTVGRPAVTENERLCTRCSLAPVCLPEEERLLENRGETASDTSSPEAGAYPSNRERQTLHVTAQKAYVTRRGESLVVKTEEGDQVLPIEQVDTLVIHGHGQVTTQAIHLCAWKGVGIEWMSYGGRFTAGLTNSPGRVQQRIRQYRALARPDNCLRLAKALVHCKIENQLKYLLRSTRSEAAKREQIQPSIDRIRECVKKSSSSPSLETLRGLEGMAAKQYFAALPVLLGQSVPDELRPTGRTRRPPTDRFNALLSYGYSLIQATVHRSITEVGLEASLGFLHQPRSAAHPLVLDLMELFRTSLWEVPLIGSVNRLQWKTDEDFSIAGAQVWLSQEGRKKAIGLFEQRLQESYKHPLMGKSLTFARLVELEVRLLEKEWTESPGLFAQWRLR